MIVFRTKEGEINFTLNVRSGVGDKVRLLITVSETEPIIIKRLEQ